MVLQRKLDYRLNGFHFPSFPSVPMSAKGKRSVRKRNVENRMCAFDLLAAVAGKLIEREKSSATCDFPGSLISNSKQKILNEKLLCNEEFPVQNDHPKVSTVTGGFMSRKDNSSWNEHSKPLKVSGTSFASLCSGSSNKSAMGDWGPSESGKVGVGKNITGNVKTTQSLECQAYEPLIDGNPLGCNSLDDSVISDIKPPLIRSESSLEVHISRDNDPYNSSFSHSWDDLELPVNRDDDENSSRCIHPCASTSKASKPYLGERRLRKLLSNRYWKVDLGAAKPAELSKIADVDLHAFGRRKICYTRQRTRRISFRRRNLFKRYSVSASHNGFNRGGVLNLLNKKEILEGNSSAAVCGVNGMPSTITEQLSSYKPEDFHVKLSIKSFTVPELYIEIPETATVGSLKRTVMEAITAIIGSGLHVGVLLQGKDFRDDDRTLIQAGISHANELDELSFTLVPNSEKPHFFLPCENNEPLTRITAGTSLDKGKFDSSSASCQALAASSVIRVEALSAVPMHNNPRRPELVQRRIRRPFTVSEVEALVQAVEKLGTGRWRDVKLRSFDDAKHRTYVDLKDKWKTLVHTARISPQQRRGEPVPQQLLDRVLHAHAYWSQQQAKLQAKLLSTEACP